MMKKTADKLILGKAIIFALLVILIIALGGLMPLMAGKKIESEKLDNHRSFSPAIPSKSIELRLASGGFDPLMEPKPDELRERLRINAYAPGEQGYYIVQFDGQVQAQQRKKLEQLGAQVFDYLPNFAFIVKMDDECRVAVEVMENVRWVGIYQPAYRMEPALAETIMAGETYSQGEFIVTLFPGEAVDLIAEQIEHLGGAVLDVSEYHQRAKLKIRIFLEDLQTVSNITGVKWIERAPIWKSHNDVAVGIMDATDVWDTHNLYGAGQVVCVADTGLDQGNTAPANLHDDFEDGSANSRVSQIFDRVGDGASDVNSGHGTHVAGSVLGNGAVSGSNPATHTYTNSYAGLAPEAGLVVQALEDNSTGALSGIPSDLNTLFSQAQSAGATIHTNSWGSAVAGSYTSFSEDVDQFVWDNEEFLILFSAGNGGIDGDGDGVIDLTSMGSPATAKNCITVGATENNRPIGSSPSPGYNSIWGALWPDDYPAVPISSDHVSNDADGMSAFSSRGPCLDGRFKPDIVAPGTNIISTKSSLTANTALWGKGGLSTSGPQAQYIFSGGTSMSTPLTAGAATLAREFFTDVEGITPSAALIKATLLNGAADISPGQYGTGSTQEIPDPPRPNNVEGWGRLDLESSIFPTAPKALEYRDETSGLATGIVHTYNFDVSDGTVPLKVTLAWTDYPGSTVAGGGLVNDLDLVLIDPASTWHYPNNASQRGHASVIAYDDGGYTEGRRLYSDDGFAVKFTPASYPAVLDKARFFLGARSTSPQSREFRCNVWDDDGAGGMPGTNLFSRDVTPPYLPSGQYCWFTVDISGATITDGSFYIELHYTSTISSNPFLTIDYTSPDNRSYVYEGSSWSLLPSAGINNGDWAIRAVVTEQDASTSSDRVNNAVGIDIATPDTGSYTIRIEGYNVPQGPQPYALVVTGGDITSLQQVSPPQAPFDLAGTVISATQVDLTWIDNSGDEDGFKIERKQGSTGTYQQIGTVATNLTTYSDMTTIGGPTYYYRVKAYNANGDSLPSNEISLTPGVPNAPSGLSATAVSHSRIDLSWTDNSVGETGFKIRRKTGAAGVWAVIAAVGADEESYVDTSCAASTAYYYQVFSCNSRGDSLGSNEADATTPAVPPPSDGGNGICFVAAAGHESFGADHFIAALVILLIGIANFGTGIGLRRKRIKRKP